MGRGRAFTRILLFFALCQLTPSARGAEILRSVKAACSVVIKGLVRKTPKEAPFQAEASLPSLLRYSHVNNDIFSLYDVRAGAHGGSKIVLQTRAGWYDLRKNLTSTGADVTLDLRLHPTLMGAREAEFFGFRQYNEKYLSIPDATEIEGAINAFNSGLQESDPRYIAIHTYPTSKSFVSETEYVQRFADHGEIPVTTQGRQFLHDISAHALEGFFLPNVLPQTLRKRARLWLDFVEHCKQQQLSQQELSELNLTNKVVLTNFTHQIDQFGMSSSGLVPDKQKLVLTKVGNKAFFQSPAPNQARILNLSTQTLTRTYHASDLWLLTGSPSEAFSQVVKDESIKRRLDAFLAAKAHSHPEALANLPFDLEAETKKLESAVSNATSQEELEHRLEGLTLGRPYVERLRRLRQMLK